MQPSSDTPALIKDNIMDELQRVTGEFPAITATENTPEYHAWVQHFNTCGACQRFDCQIGRDLLDVATGVLK